MNKRVPNLSQGVSNLNQLRDQRSVLKPQDLVIQLLFCRRGLTDGEFHQSKVSPGPTNDFRNWFCGFKSGLLFTGSSEITGSSETPPADNAACVIA